MDADARRSTMDARRSTLDKRGSKMDKRASKMNVPGGEGASKMKNPRRRSRSHKGHKGVRVHLPTIESYEKELVFPAEGPGRVIVRLERLMGSDRVRLTDAKYMATLLERLEEEESQSWTKRRINRIKAEKNRFRKLAIDGLIEPGPDMQDLQGHPVFRVNRVLKHITKMDANTNLTPTDHLPPIIEVDPFRYDDTGAIFKGFPGHHSKKEDFNKSRTKSFFDAEREFLTTMSAQLKIDPRFHGSKTVHGSVQVQSQPTVVEVDSKSKTNTGVADATKTQTNLDPDTAAANTEDPRKSSARPSVISSVPSKSSIASGPSRASSRVSIASSAPPRASSQMSVQSDASTIVDEERKSKRSSRKSSKRLSSRLRRLRSKNSKMELHVPTMEEMREFYRIPEDHDLSKWEPFREFLVDNMFHEDGKRIEELYEMAEGIVDMYEREQIAADEFTLKLYRMLRG